MNEPDPKLEAEIQAILAQHEGLTREQLLKHLQREEGLAEGSRAPFPGPLREAFASGPREVVFAGTPPIVYRLQPVTLALISALEQIESPFIAMVDIIGSMQGRPGKEITQAIEKKLHPKTEQLIATVYCFVTDMDQVESELEKGPAALRKTAKKNIGRRHHPTDLAKLYEAILNHYVESFSTSVDYRAKKAEGDQSFPSASAEPKTASAGA